MTERELALQALKADGPPPPLEADPQISFSVFASLEDAPEVKSPNLQQSELQSVPDIGVLNLKSRKKKGKKTGKEQVFAASEAPATVNLPEPAQTQSTIAHKKKKKKVVNISLDATLIPSGAVPLVAKPPTPKQTKLPTPKSSSFRKEPPKLMSKASIMDEMLSSMEAEVDSLAFKKSMSFSLCLTIVWLSSREQGAAAGAQRMSADTNGRSGQRIPAGAAQTEQLGHNSLARRT